MDQARSPWPSVAGVFAILFGFVTLKEGSSVLFIDGAARQAAGNYVPFVVWFNVIAAFGYVVAGLALLRRRPEGAKIAIALSASTAAVLALFGAHVMLGGAWEKRTLLAMVFRTLVWAGIAVIGCRALGCGATARATAG